MAREIYKKRRSLGLCVYCGNALDRNGAYCEECRKRQTEHGRERRHWYQEGGICPRCCKNELWGDEKLCLECATDGYRKTIKRRKVLGADYLRIYERGHKRKKRQKCREEGICYRCEKRKADYGYKTCGICREKHRERQASHNYKQKTVREIWKENGMCHFCGNPAKEGYRTCEACYQRLANHCEEMRKHEEAQKYIARIKQDNMLVFHNYARR